MATQAELAEAWKISGPLARHRIVAELHNDQGMKAKEIAFYLGIKFNSAQGYLTRHKAGRVPQDRARSRASLPLVRDIFARADELQMSTKTLAYKTGYNYTTISFIRQGRTPNPTFMLVRDIAEAVGLDLILTPRVKEK